MSRSVLNAALHKYVTLGDIISFGNYLHTGHRSRGRGKCIHSLLYRILLHSCRLVTAPHKLVLTGGEKLNRDILYRWIGIQRWPAKPYIIQTTIQTCAFCHHCNPSQLNQPDSNLTQQTNSTYITQPNPTPSISAPSSIFQPIKANLKPTPTYSKTT